MRDPSTLLLVNNKGADQPAHSRSLVSAFVIRYLKSKVTRSDVSQFSNLFGGLQLDKASGWAPGVSFGILISSDDPHAGMQYEFG